MQLQEILTLSSIVLAMLAVAGLMIYFARRKRRRD